MNLFKKKENLLQNMTYMGLMAAINFVFILLSNFVPFLLFILVFVLPLASCIVSLICKKRYYIIYAVATLLVCLLINIPDTLFYVLPSIITGFIFAIFLDKKIPGVYTIFILSLIQVLLSILFLAIYYWITGRNIVGDITTIFHLQDYKYINELKPLIFYIVSLIQITLTYILLKVEISKFKNIDEIDLPKMNLINFIAVCFFLILMIVFATINFPLSYLMLAFTLFFAIFDAINLIIYKKQWIYILIVITLIITFFFVAFLFNLIPAPNGLLLLGIFPLLIETISILNNYFVKKQNK